MHIKYKKIKKICKNYNGSENDLNILAKSNRSIIFNIFEKFKIDFYVKLLEKAVKLNNPIALYRLTYNYSLDKKYVQAAKLYEKDIKLNGVSLNNLACMYDNGTHPDGQNYVKAAELYEKAIKFNNNPALYNLACMYENGTHPDGQNYVKAAELYEKACKLKCNFSFNNLAYMYNNGTHPDGQNYIKAAELYEKVCSFNDIGNCMYHLACMYKDGTHPSGKNIKKSIKLLEKLRKNNYPSAFNTLGIMYYNGTHTEGSNIEKAIELFEKAIELYEKATELYEKESNLTPLYNLLFLYEEKDNKKIVELLEKAFSNGKYEVIIKMSEYVSKKLYPDENYEIMYNRSESEPFRNKILKPIKKLKTIYTDIKTDDCIICKISLMNTDDNIIILTCGHSFHYNCYSVQSKCPFRC